MHACCIPFVLWGIYDLTQPFVMRQCVLFLQRSRLDRIRDRRNVIGWPEFFSVKSFVHKIRKFPFWKPLLCPHWGSNIQNISFPHDKQLVVNICLWKSSSQYEITKRGEPNIFLRPVDLKLKIFRLFYSMPFGF